MIIKGIVSTKYELTALINTMINYLVTIRDNPSVSAQEKLKAVVQIENSMPEIRRKLMYISTLEINK